MSDTAARFIGLSCPRSSRASTPSGHWKNEDVDGRDKPGHDDVGYDAP
jgi:hypothetical protein